MDVSFSIALVIQVIYPGFHAKGGREGDIVG